MNCKEALPLMHEFLDGDLSRPEAIRLKEHLIACVECKSYFKALERTEAMVRSVPDVAVPDDLVERIMAGLPPVKKKNAWLQWVRRHPGISVAVVFVAVMFGSFTSMWNQNDDLMVKGSDLQNLVFEGDTVIVPAGRTINGNLIVQSGKLKVEGDVTGNLVVIDGSLNLASTAHISGQITQVDEAMSWVWYKVNEFVALLSR
jgi:anti-sigma factor RsiW